MNQFKHRLKLFCDQLRNGERPAVIDRKQIVLGVRYNIHKRSLPVGLDLPIAWGVSEDEATKLIAKCLKSRLIKDEKETYDVIYYDMVREDGLRSSVYDNPPEIIKEDYTEECSSIRYVG
jgi:hypothetical protein